MSENFFGSIIRRKILIFIIIGFSSIAIMNLFYMQILKNISYEEKAKENSIKGLVQPAPRGVFFDRNFNVVVSNKPSFAVQITPAFYDRNNDKIIESVLGVSDGYIDEILQSNRIYSKYLPRKIKRNVDFKFIAWFEENEEFLTGVDYIVELQRDYAFDICGAHMFGYIKEISSDQYQNYRNLYDLGDLVGYNGIEKTYENLLRGKKGSKFTLIDSNQKTIGRYLEGRQDIEPIKGNDLVLTIDADLQKLAEKLLEGKRGAIVAIEPATGEVLAFASAPKYDLSVFGTVTSSKEWAKLNNDKEKPMFNRATMSIYSPGSTFKPLAALAALEEGVITKSTKIFCGGYFQFGNRKFHCMASHGRVNIVEAIEKSCNTFFYQLILRIGLDKWAEYSHKFGFGEKSELDIGEEIAGNVPDSKYYDRVFGKNKWTDGYVVNLGIGQGELSVTPVQLAKYVAMIANNGRTGKPHLVKGIVYSDTHQFVPIDPQMIDANISQESFDIVKEGMFKVVNGDGSAKWIKRNDIKIAGKTGTSQNPFGEDHALFIGFAPFDDPKIAVSVVIENAGFGSTHAAPIARDLIVAYVNKLKDADKLLVNEIEGKE